ncbi:AAA family ATPase [Maridesulfovibrio sp.]|uniref:AAA family ATPase n=1 Tax=Maridesulfovibrio sp. TaxID=2795000 RepID=UPI0029F48429|nr:AAA family ATPase [Maridesulfovibrio sp.]
MISSTTEWLTRRPKWLQVAAKHLLASSNINEATISELSVLCQQEANNEFPDIDCSIPSSAFKPHNPKEIRLCAISEVEGVNKLAPRNSLDFGKSNIAIVYGQNGSGKSGYVRLLKHICGARDCTLGLLHNNIFSAKEVVQKAKISFLKNNSPTEHEWSGKGVCKDLCSVDIFDTSFGRVFIGNEGEVSYEPPILSFFSRLINVCEKVASKLDTDSEALKSKMPSIPSSYVGSKGAAWVEKLSAKTSADEVEAHCSFTPENEKDRQDLLKRISEPSPADKAIQFRNKKSHADAIVKDVQVYLNQLSDNNCRKIIAAKKKAILKKTAAEATAKDIFRDAKLEGVGSDIWKELWNAARKYSEELAYCELDFPNVQDDSVCVLCQQPLSGKAKHRLTSFETYIKGLTQKQAADAAKDLKQAIDDLPEIPSIEAFKTKIDAAGIENQDIIKGLNATLSALQHRMSKVPSFDSEETLDNFNLSPNWIEEIHKISKTYEDSAKKYEDDAANDNREELQVKLNDLRAKKWLTEQKVAIQEEISRLQKLKRIKEAKKKTNSATLSTKKGKLAESLITDAFVQRFNDELKALGASRIKVKLVKSKVSKGKVLHTLQLDGADHSLSEILSEGESRIVSIAAFVADVAGRNYPTPLVFDDPISSLDQDYEEAVVQRLCSIASERQIIIFTHRLSLMGMFQDYAKKVAINPEIICIREESWGTGEPGDTPLFAKKPDKALNKLINERLSKAKRLFNEHGKEVYEPYAKALCSDFRILLERMIECELLADVVQRYRRAINTMGKIGNLAKISEEDCSYFDDLMTKYSRYEHSQPLEAPVSLPAPDELEPDFKGLQQWQAAFKARPIPLQVHS